jgi:hypothetical protein
MRRANPVPLEREVASQRRASRRGDHHVQRPQQLGGARVSRLRGYPESGYPDPADFAGRRRVSGGDEALDGDNRPIQEGWFSLANEWASSVESAVIHTLDTPFQVWANGSRIRPDDSQEIAGRWTTLEHEATEELVQALHPCMRLPEHQELPRRLLVLRWVTKWGTHEELTPWGRRHFVTSIPRTYDAVRRRLELDALAEEIRSLRREMRAGFAHNDARLSEIHGRLAEMSIANPDDRDFAREVERLIEEARAA